MQTVSQKPRSGVKAGGNVSMPYDRHRIRHNRKRLSALILDWLKFLANFSVKVKDCATVGAHMDMLHLSSALSSARMACLMV